MPLHTFPLLPNLKLLLSTTNQPLTLLLAAQLGFASLKMALWFGCYYGIWASNQDKSFRCIILFSLHNSPPICILTSPPWYRRRNEEDTTKTTKMLGEPSLARSWHSRQNADTNDGSCWEQMTGS